MKRLLTTAAVAALTIGLLGCTPRETSSTPLPTREKTVGKVEKGLDTAAEEAAKRKAEVEAQTGK